MIYVKDTEKLKSLQQNIYLGLISKSGFTNSVDSKWWEFQIYTFGRRSIMNDISSAIGLVQLEKLPGFIAKRKQVAELYDSLLANVDWIELPPALKNYQKSSYYMYHVQIKNPDDRDRLASYLREKNIYTTFRYYSLHWVDLYGQKSLHLPNAAAALCTLCLPIHQSLSDEDSRIYLPSNNFVWEGARMNYAFIFLGEFGYELFNWQGLGRIEFIFSSDLNLINGVHFGSWQKFFSIYDGEGHKQNLYAKINYDSEELKRDLENRLQINLSEPYVLIQGRKRDIVIRSTHVVPIELLIKKLAEKFPS